MIFDPSTSYDIVQEQIPAVPFVDHWSPVFNLNSSFTDYLHNQSMTCGYANYFEENLKYPPSGPLPLPMNSSDISGECDLWVSPRC